MNYHDIVKDDMRNGSGLRVTLFVSGCKHHCPGCHNPQTWSCESGIPFDEAAFDEIKKELAHDYISGITFSGGDPLHENNRDTIKEIAEYVKNVAKKNVWLYTGYRFREVDGNFFFTDDLNDKFELEWLDLIDVLVDGPFDIELADKTYYWAGSRNQRVIDIRKSLDEKFIRLFK